MWLEWDMRSWCWQPGYPVGQHYKIVRSMHCHKVIPVLIWLLMLLGCKTTTNKNKAYKNMRNKRKHKTLMGYPMAKYHAMNMTFCCPSHVALNHHHCQYWNSLWCPGGRSIPTHPAGLKDSELTHLYFARTNWCWPGGMGWLNELRVCLPFWDIRVFGPYMFKPWSSQPNDLQISFIIQQGGDSSM